MATLAPPIPSGNSDKPRTCYFRNGEITDFKAAKDGQTGTVKGLKIFRAGNFPDSMGISRTWTADHLHQMVSNFTLLNKREVLTDVPVRADHSDSIDKVKGYISKLTTDGEFLYADLEITEPDAVAKIDRKTYRGRSIEITMFESNDQEAYWPVVRGLAFVDLPAVQGLYSAQRSDEFGSVIIDEETPVPEVKPEATVHQFSISGKTETDPALVQAHIATLEARPGPANFRIAGVDTTDITAVQAHIDGLEAFGIALGVLAREQFVDALVASNHVAAPKKADVLAFVAGLDDSQFAAYKTSFADAPANPLFIKHSATASLQGSDNPSGNDIDPVADAIEVHEGIVANHRKAGMDEAWISKTRSFKELERLTAQR